MSSYSSVQRPFFPRMHQGSLMSGGRKGRSRWRGWLARGLTLMAVGAVLVPGGATFGQSDKARAKIVLEGAGATFPAPLYKKWIGVFMSENPDIAVSYKEVGSGEGVRRFLAQSVDFGASDGWPTIFQASGATCDYADIFLRRITTWSDPRIRALNPMLHLPSRSIAVAARQDGSGTTFALANHLAAISPAWREGPGVGYLIDWGGRAMRARGNEGVASLIKLGEGTIGYVEYGFAKRLGLAMAHLENKAGQYVAPGDRSGQTALASNVKQMPDNLRLYLPDPDGVESYPIVSLSWLLLYDRYEDGEKNAAIKRFVAWGLSAGQSYAADLGYVPLPGSVVSLSRSAVEQTR